MNEFISIMILGLCFTLVLIISSIPIAYLIVEIQDQIEKNKKKKYFGKDNEILQQRIVDYFHLKYGDIPILFGEEEYFKENFSTACGLCSYTTYNHDLFTAHNFILRIRGKFNSFQWTTLAHEIGHYISITEFQDDSEEGADYEAGVFMINMLSKEEQKLLHISLNVCFNVGNEEFNSFKHKSQNSLNDKVVKLAKLLKE